MTFIEALTKLGIEKYADRIINSNSRGELFHLDTYLLLAKEDIDKEEFSIWFDEVVEFAEENWERPESVFQHIDKMI